MEADNRIGVQTQFHYIIGADEQSEHVVSLLYWDGWKWENSRGIELIDGDMWLTTTEISKFKILKTFHTYIECMEWLDKNKETYVLQEDEETDKETSNDI